MQEVPSIRHAHTILIGTISTEFTVDALFVVPAAVWLPSLRLLPAAAGFNGSCRVGLPTLGSFDDQRINFPPRRFHLLPVSVLSGTNVLPCINELT